MTAELPSIADCRLLELPKIVRPEGDITPITGEDTVPFPIQRAYYIYDVRTGAGRGGHAHVEMDSLIVAVMGSFRVVLDDGAERRPFMLNRADRGLLVPRMMWRELEEFSSGAICLVLASRPYAESDYIRSHDDFMAARSAARSAAR